MAKPRRDWAGSSCHVHQSLWERDGGPNSFFDHEHGHGLSPAGRHYAGGLLATMREFTALFAPTPASGTITVDGANVSVAVVFSAVSFYDVTVTESGLPNGTAWFVAVETNGSAWTFGLSTSSNVTFQLPNGTYGLEAGVTWVAGVPYVPTPSYETVTVAGAAVTIDVTYAAA